MECGMRMNKVCARCVTETRVVGPKGNEFHEIGAVENQGLRRNIEVLGNTERND